MSKNPKIGLWTVTEILKLNSFGDQQNQVVMDLQDSKNKLSATIRPKTIL